MQILQREVIFGRKEKFTSWIMILIAFQRQISMLYSLAIHTSMGAGIVFANIFRGKTATLDFDMSIAESQHQRKI